jgi:hypothetical protein
MSASDYQNIYLPYEKILYHNNLPAINVHLFIYFIYLLLLPKSSQLKVSPQGGGEHERGFSNVEAKVDYGWAWFREGFKPVILYSSR